ncbi:hypothetical protein D3Z46_10005 [Bacteroides sartorii]|nr:hypothetical protein [Phocaeicola sartorii]
MESYIYTIFISPLCFSVKIVYSFYISNKKWLKFLFVSVFLWNTRRVRSKQGVKMGLFRN